MNITIIKMHYSIVPRDRIYVKDYEFDFYLWKYSQKSLDSAKTSATDAKTLLQKEQFKN